MKKRDYSRPERTPFPRELAVMITRKADAMARKFEDEVTRRLVRDAQRALDQGYSLGQIAKELGLPKPG